MKHRNALASLKSHEPVGHDPGAANGETLIHTPVSPISELFGGLSHESSQISFHIIPHHLHCFFLIYIRYIKPIMAAPPPAGQQPTPQQMAQMQQQLAMEAARQGLTIPQLQAKQRAQLEAEAKKEGLTFPQYIEKLRAAARENHQKAQEKVALQAQQQAQQGQGQPQVQGQQGQQVPITPGAPDPKAQALAKWLRGQDLKTRTCILNGQRKDMFRGTQSSILPLTPYHAILKS